MNREERAGSTDSVVTDDSEDPLTCPLTQRLFHDPDPFGDPWGRLLAKESQSASGLSSLGGPPSAGNLSSANYGEPSPSLSNRSVAGGYGEPAGLGLSAASLPYDGGSPYA